VLSLELQIARRHDEIARLDNDLLKYLCCWICRHATRRSITRS
jgi:hypothetical protein